ncbi:hypothetical protein DMENIID0001_025900 [Sergentomyia squamirostris]
MLMEVQKLVLADYYDDHERYFGQISESEAGIMMQMPDMYGSPFPPYSRQSLSHLPSRNTSPPTTAIDLKRYPSTERPAPPTTPVPAHLQLPVHHGRESLIHQRQSSGHTPPR